MKPDFTLFSDNLDYALGWMVVHTLWQATLIAFISGILMVAMRKKAAKIRYIVANIALLMVVVSAVVTFCLYYDFATEPAKVSFNPTTSYLVMGNNVNIANEISTPKSEVATPLSIQGFKDYFNHNIPLIVTIWILGVAVFMLKLLGGISYIYYLKNRMNFPADEYWADMLQKLSDKAGLARGIDIVESAMVRTPMVVGHLKPMIMFPMGIINRLAPEEVEAILAHELAHVMRKDFIFNILQSVVEALFYFHPAVWWLSSQISNERESACDDIAIELINSKINYARALVAIQEMAYFPLTPSLAFAGQRKSQFLMRMQRILNQPNNKTNIMEKLIATCSLILLMVGLTFGGNFNTNSTLSSTENTPSVSEENTDNPEAIDINRYLYLPQKVDSLPVAEEVVDGIYKYEDNTQKAEITLKNNHVIALKVNDIDLKEEQFINYKKLIDKVLRTNVSSIAKPSTNTDNDHGGSTTTIEGVTSPNQSGQSSFSYSDDNSNIPISGNARIDENKYPNVNIGKNKKDTYNTIRFKADDGYSYIVFDLNGEKIWKCYRNEMLLGDLVVKNDNKIYFNNKVATSAELLNLGLVYYNNALNPKTGAFQITTVDKRGEWDMNIREDKNGYAYSYSTDDGNNDELRDQIKELQGDIKELRKEIKECQCTDNFDFRMGLIEELDRLFPVASSKNRNVFNAFEKRFLDIKNRWEQGECDDFKQNKNNSQGNFNGSYFNNNGNQDLDARVKNISKKAKSLKDAIDDCACKSKDPNWVIWAKARLNAQYALAQNNKNDYGLKMVENEIATIEQQFNRLKNQSGTTNCEDCPPGNGQNNTVYSTSPNSYSYGTGTSKADAERAQKDAQKRVREAQQRSAEAQRQAQEDRRISGEDEQRAKDRNNRAKSSEENSRQDKAMRSIFLNLKDMGFIELNKKHTIDVKLNKITVDGKTLDNAAFSKIKNDFESKLGKKATSMSVYFKGTIQQLSNDHLDMSGTFSNSLSTDD